MTLLLLLSQRDFVDLLQIIDRRRPNKLWSDVKEGWNDCDQYATKSGAEKFQRFKD